MLAAMLLFPQVCIAAAAQALRIWALDVAPSLFPYMVLSRLLAQRLSAAGIPGALSAPLLGLLGGSPSGACALSVCAQAGRLSSRALHVLSALCGTISPMFFLGTIARWTGDAALARKLLAAHLIGAGYAALVVLALSALHKRRPVSTKQESTGASDSPIVQSVDAVLGVGGCILFYSVLAALVSRILPASLEPYRPVLHAALETAGGTHALLASGWPLRTKAVLCAALCGFSGFSILTQNAIFLRPLGIPVRRLILYGLLRAMGAGTAMALML